MFSQLQMHFLRRYELRLLFFLFNKKIQKKSKIVKLFYEKDSDFKYKILRVNHWFLNCIYLFAISKEKADMIIELRD